MTIRDRSGPRTDPPSRRFATSVVIVTYERPEHLAQCLRCLAEQDVSPDEVIVVDASVSDQSQRIALGRSEVTYIRNPAGRGHMTNSRNVGWRASSGDIVAFIDDDAFAAADWLEHLITPYGCDWVGAVGGRAARSEFDVPRVAQDVGSIARDGQLIGNFDCVADDGLDVCHLIGCNMSFRRHLLEELDGFREDDPGTEVREETDVCFRVIERGYKLRYEPKALVIHVGGPYVRGRRFDVRYEYYAARNHAQLLVRHFGAHAPVVRSFARSTLLESARNAGASLFRAAARLAGLVVGLVAGISSPGRPRGAPKSTGKASALSAWLDDRGRAIGTADDSYAIQPSDAHGNAAATAHRITRR